jgi:aryl-alcohol dehydrogenase-like predicted oxidoreductase
MGGDEVTLPQRILGRSGLRVSELCLGTMTFGTEWGWGASEAVCRDLYGTFREAGGNFIDTANNYTNGSSEEIVGRLVAEERDSIVLATKFTLPTDGSDLNSGGSHRKSLKRSIEGSLRRLATDYIDVLWVHAWDRCTPELETVRALDDLVRSGKVLAIGVSNTPAWIVSWSQGIAEMHGWTSFCAMQVEYSLSSRTADRDLIPMAKAFDLALTAWSPLAGGLLSGKFSHRDPAQNGATGRAHSGRLSPSQQRIMEVVLEIGAEIDAPPASVAIAWVVEQGLIPVLGARTVEQLEGNLKASTIQLDDAQMARLDAVTRIELGYPYDFLRELCPFLTPEWVAQGSPMKSYGAT